jgi:hypothetical protein
MRLPALKHLVQAIHALSKSNRICVLGSSALLGTFPELGDQGGPLELSFDADLLVEPCDEEMAAMIHEAVGEGSLFARREGYHADIMRPNIVETLPPGWESRLVRLDESANALALSPEDLIVAKMRVGRAKDMDLCRAMIDRSLITPAILRARLDATPMPESEVVTVYQRLNSLLA